MATNMFHGFPIDLLVLQLSSYECFHFLLFWFSHFFKDCFVSVLCCIYDSENTGLFSNWGILPKNLCFRHEWSSFICYVSCQESSFILFVACCAADGGYIISRLFREGLSTRAPVEEVFLCQSSCVLMDGILWYIQGFSNVKISFQILAKLFLYFFKCHLFFSPFILLFEKDFIC